MNLKGMFGLVKASFQEWSADKAPVQAAALAYYTIFAIAPLLIIVIAVVGLVLGEEAVRGELIGRIRGAVGENSAELIQGMIASTSRRGSGVLATVIGVVLLLVGATGVFIQLQAALNEIWDVTEKKKKGGILTMLKDRLLSFGMILAIGFLLLVSFILSAAVAAVSSYFSNLLPGTALLWRLLELVVSFGIITLLFALIFKYLPDAQISWRDVWIGAAVTALLFVIGKFLIGLYLGRASVASAYGAAGSLVVLLLWIYYSAQIVLFGAEFTQVYAKRFGSKVVSERAQAAQA